MLAACPKDSQTTMVEIPPYMRLVATQGQRRTVGAARPNPGNPSAQGHERTHAAVPRLPLAGDTVELRTGRDLGENQDTDDYANPYLAQKALDDLSWQLPELGQGVHDLHADLNRGRVLALLAPLVENDPIS